MTSVTRAGTDGVVTEHSFLTVVSGRPTLQVTATCTAARTYRVEGHVGERPVNETKKLAADALFGKTPAKGSTLAFQPTHEEPTRFEERKERDVPGGTVYAGGVAIRKDERGMPKEIDIPLAGGVTAKATLEIERGAASALRW